MGLCFCSPQKSQSMYSVQPHSLSYKVFKNDQNTIENQTVISSNYKPAEIFNSNINPQEMKEHEDIHNDITQKFQSEIIIENEGDDILSKIEENNNRKTTIKIEDFILLKVIGRGSFGKVLLVEKKDTRKLYAMKILRKEIIEKRNQKLHTKAERQILGNMNCPFIVQLQYAFQTEEKLYLVMEFMRGGEMFYHLRKSKKFDEEKTQFYIAEIILALEYLHKRDIIYRDLKPENVLLNEDGHIKLVDFGLSKLGVAFGDKAYTFCGTPEYLAPEILLGKGHDKSADWWSLGALMYEMLSGAPPFYSKDKTLMFKNILEKPIPMKKYFSPEASSLLQSLLCLDPEKRLGSSIADADEIKKHTFFKKIDWNFVAEKVYDPPFCPKISGRKDVGNFDQVFTDEIPKDTPANYEKKENYSNFTYAAKEMNFGDSNIMQSGMASLLSGSDDLIENPAFTLDLLNRK